MGKHILSAILCILCLLIILTGCQKADENVTAQVSIEPKITQIQNICEFAVLECQYHNVTEIKDPVTQKNLFGKNVTKYKEFWLEYNSTIKLGIDASLVSIEVNDTTVTITLPETKLLNCDINLDDLKHYVDNKSVKPDYEDEKEALARAKKEIADKVSQETDLLNTAQARVRKLLENYINTLGNAINQKYTIEWVYLND